MRTTATGLLRAAMQFSALALLVASAAPSLAQKVETKTLTVFAAASLKNALDDAAAAYLQSTGTRVIVSYAASSALAKQIENGAPADVFVSADAEWADYLNGKGLLLAGTRQTMLSNRLVLIAPAASQVALKIERGFALAAALGAGRLSVANVKAVPAGKYAKAALEALGVWASVEAELAEAENVRAALTMVAQGEAPLGIVYASDAVVEPKVKVLDTFPPASHPPIVYPVAVTQASASPEAAKAFIAFLMNADTQRRLVGTYGFQPPQ